MKATALFQNMIEFRFWKKNRLEYFDYKNFLCLVVQDISLYNFFFDEPFFWHSALV